MNDSKSFDPAPLPVWQADRLAVLLDALGGIPISDAERVSLTWLAGWERQTVENVAELIRRARGEVITRHREADRYQGQLLDLWLLDLCEWAGIEPGENPHAALLEHLRGAERSGS